MFLYRLKNFVCVSITVLFVVLVFVGVKSAHISRLSAWKGDRTFFLDSASSQGLMKKELSFADLGRVKGECVSFQIKENEGGMSALKQKILEEYDAEILFMEKTGEVESYYCYTTLWQGGIFLNGVLVNLHFAFSQTQCVVGTPIIFGGF